MRMQPRQQLLEIWNATVRSSWSDREKKWKFGGRDAPNSIGDAEQLLCILMPATKVESFKLDRPDETSEDMIRALRPLGNATEIPKTLITILREYFDRYSDPDGTPIFAGSSYFSSSGPAQPSKEQLRLDIVDSFAMSVTLSLSVLGFLKVLRSVASREENRKEIDSLEEQASTRLSAAMTGLLRSFTVNVFDIDSSFGQAMIGMINQENLPQRQVVSALRRDLRETIASFREVLIGSGQVGDIDSPDRLFEVGWSWGIVSGAPPIETTEPVGQQQKGYAQDAPYLYFTVIAVDAIEDLFSERTRVLGLLNEEQQRLSRALQLRWELTRSYWSTIATFGTGPRWPVEDIPWRTTDEDASDYYTLLVTSLAVKGLVQERGTDIELGRIGDVVSELANRARITRRPFDTDPALNLHAPGVLVPLVGSEDAGEARLLWTVSEFSALLFQRTTVIAGLINDAEGRSRMLELADRTWDHLNKRRLDKGSGRNLWDQPTAVFGQLTTRYDKPSWYYTQRVVQGLVTTANMLNRPPLRSPRLGNYAFDLLTEAEHLYDMELLSGAGDAGPRMRETLKVAQIHLSRAREILPERPGTAAVLAAQVLISLDELAAARRDVTEAG
ncbi:SCO2524 family protein [Asanoa sp. WMMD1127]|uniref:SCO2524 family protein n=1 Tax=Asanoa sp. WMMD1127 TaxID=3016107 RepID=UPI002416628A|nr:SCO2524 family protein [Asanoa sp. WMMD1127]MDG4821792.1 SCO2524 family protein [Asanoa sp. WMMD1127]